MELALGLSHSMRQRIIFTCCRLRPPPAFSSPSQRLCLVPDALPPLLAVTQMLSCFCCLTRQTETIQDMFYKVILQWGGRICNFMELVN